MFPDVLSKRPSAAELQQRILRIYDHLYANSAKRTPGGIAREAGKILHAGMFAEQVENVRPAFNFSPLELEALRRGAKEICGGIAEDTRQRFKRMNQAWKLYGRGEKLLLDDFDLSFTCSELTGILISSPDQDVFGDAFEIFRSEWAKRAGGQFFTDPLVTHLAMSLLDFDPRRGDDLVDISAGTGGFLLAGINHTRALLEADHDNGPIETTLAELALKNIHGQEVDEEICGIANGTLAARLGLAHGSFVALGDSLAPVAFDSDQHAIRLGQHLCAATNPPFGTKITIKDPQILLHYELAATKADDSAQRRNATHVRARPPDVLMLERNINILKPGEGRLAIVLPYQLLSGPQAIFVRRWLLRNAQPIAVIDLPPETFQPHTGTKTALVVVRRRPEPLGEPQDADDDPIFMSIPRWIGHDRRGNPVYRREADGSITGEILTDFAEVADAYSLFKQGKRPNAAHPASFRVPALKITTDPLLRLNALYYRPREHRVSGRARKTGGQPARYSTVRLEDVVKRIFFPGRFKRNYVDYFPGAVPFLGGSNITELIPPVKKWIRPDDPKLPALRVEAGWILITRSGSTGIVSSVPTAWAGYAMSEHVIRIVPDPAKLDPHYLEAVLRTELVQEQVSRGVFGSVIDEITPEFLGQLAIPIPSDKRVLNRISREVQRSAQARQTAIESIAGAVDELNSTLTGNATEHMQTITNP